MVQEKAKIFKCFILNKNKNPILSIQKPNILLKERNSSTYPEKQFF